MNLCVLFVALILEVEGSVSTVRRNDILSINSNQTYLFEDFKNTLDLSNVVLHNINNVSENVNRKVDIFFEDIKEKQLINSTSDVLSEAHEMLTLFKTKRIIEKSSNLIDLIQKNVEDASNLFENQTNALISYSYVFIPLIIICIIFVILQSFIVAKFYRKFVKFEKIISVSVDEEV